MNWNFAILFVFLIYFFASTFLFLKSNKKRTVFFNKFSSNQANSDNSNRINYNSSYKIIYIISTTVIALSCLFLCTLPNTFSDSSNNNSKINHAKTNEIIFLLDISNSMNAIDADFTAKMSRLEIAKHCINNLVTNISNSSENNVNFGLIIFAREPQILVPISDDIIFFKQILSTVNTNSISNQGTNIAIGIDEAIQTFSKTAICKSLILMTDAENHEGNIDGAITVAAANKISIFSIGFGSQNGTSLQIENNFFTTVTEKSSKNEIITLLNYKILAQISEKNYIYPFNEENFIKEINILQNESNFNHTTTYSSLNLATFSLFLILILQFFLFVIRNNF